jgi:hypothetical protein
VILVTDGAETCAGDPVARAGDLFAAADADGRVPVHVIGFSTAAPTVNAQLQQIAVAGGTGTFVAADDEVELSAAIEDIVAGTILTEACNQLDDGCDGLIDEDFPDKGALCGNGGAGACAHAGVRACRADGLGTTCDAIAVSCVNQRLRDTAGNDLGPCVEVCNGIDDDCDTMIDEGLTCGCAPLPEQCNGQDDDCDGVIDNGVGVVTCTDCCVGPCCGFDAQGVCIDDCTTYQDIGECDLGNTVCAAGGLRCVDYVGPRPEVCNGLDDDCDGMTDDDAPCPADSVCVGGRCLSPCAAGEFPCPFGFVCSEVPGCGVPGDCRFCTPDPCLDVECPAGQQCDSTIGMCVDRCLGVDCPAGATCLGGLCVDCFQLGCDAGELCVRDQAGVGVCVTDACRGVDCGADGFCRAGTCIPLSCTPSCGNGTRCLNGTCVPDRCHVRCPDDEICRPDDGRCVADPCADVSCRAGQACRPVDGECIDDPCAQIVCPAGRTCELAYDGTATCPDGRSVTEAITVGGSGCSGGGGAGGGAPAGLLLVGLALARRRRRRR